MNTLMLSSLTVIGTSRINNRVSIGSSLFITSNSIINSNISINSSLNISGFTFINSNVSLLSNINILGRMTAKLKNYNLNSAARIGGIPVGGLYRNGGIVVMRLNDLPPTIYLSGSFTLTTYIYSRYTDPGVYAIDYKNNYKPVYLTSLSSGGTNILSNTILIDKFLTVITQMSTLVQGNYTATYSATDSSGLIGYNYRSINIVFDLNLKLIPLSSSSMYYIGKTVDGGYQYGIIGIYYSGGYYMAVPYTGGFIGINGCIIYISTDYYNWSPINIGSLYPLSSLTGNGFMENSSLRYLGLSNGLFVVGSYQFGSIYYYYIYNANTNTLTPFPTNGTSSFNVSLANNLCWYKYGNTIYYTDGITWTSSGTIPSTTTPINVSYVNNLYICYVWNSFSSKYFLYSTSNKINWTNTTDLTPLFINNGITNIGVATLSWSASNGNIAILAGTDIYGTSNTIFTLYSYDGINWTYNRLPYFPVQLTGINNPNNNNSYILKGLHWTNRMFIIRFDCIFNTYTAQTGTIYGTYVIGFFFSIDGVVWNISSTLFYVNPGGVSFPDGIWVNNSGGLNSMICSIANERIILPLYNPGSPNRRPYWYSN